LDDIEELSRASGCLPQYIRKGIALSTFILGRCFERGLGITKDPSQAISMYKKVNIFERKNKQTLFYHRVFNMILMLVNYYKII